MQCPACQAANIDGSDTCETCGQSLTGMEQPLSELELGIVRHSVSILNPRPAVVLNANSSVREAMEEMRERGIGCVLVAEDAEPVGIFTERDILNKVTEDRSVLSQPIREFMTAQPETVSPDDSLAYALQAMDVGGYRHLPVVNCQAGVGIVSSRDILRFLSVRFADIRR